MASGIARSMRKVARYGSFTKCNPVAIKTPTRAVKVTTATTKSEVVKTTSKVFGRNKSAPISATGF